MVVQREQQIKLLAASSGSQAVPTTTLLGTEITTQQLLQIAMQDEQVKKFIASGDYDIYLDILDESDFGRLPAIYKDLPKNNLFQFNFTRANGALLVILTPEKVHKVVPVTNLRIL